MKKWSTAEKFILLICFLFTTFTDANDRDAHVAGLIDNDPQDESSANVQAAVQHYASGNITTHRVVSSSSSSGGTLQLFRSANWAQPSALRRRVHASKIHKPEKALYPVNEGDTSQNATRRKSLESDTLPHTRRKYFRNDLHTAFRLPLQRLSDRQLTSLLQNYHKRVGKEMVNVDYSKMEKSEKISRLKSLIIRRTGTESGRLQLIRPTLLTNINVINENDVNLTPPPSFAIGQNIIEEKLTSTDSTKMNIHSSILLPETTIVPENAENYFTIPSTTTKNHIVEDRKHQKEIPELMQFTPLEDEKINLSPKLLSTESTNIEEELTKFRNSNESNEISYFAKLLSEFKARYEKIKALFKVKLQELNKKKALLTAHKEENMSTTTDTNQFTSKLSPITDALENTQKIEEHEEFSTTQSTETDIIKSNKDSNKLKYEPFQSNQKLLDSSNELVSEQRTYPSELITPKMRSLITETTSLPSTQSYAIETESVSQFGKNELQTEVSTPTTNTDESITTEDTNLATTSTTKNAADIEAADPFSDSKNVRLEENTENVKHEIISTSSNATVKSESRLIKKLLGILQYVKKNKSQKSSVLHTSDLNSTKLIEILNNEKMEEQNEEEQKKSNGNDQVAHSEIPLKNPAPRARVIPKTFATSEIDISLPPNKFDNNEENIERAEIISARNEENSDGNRIIMKNAGELSTMELINNLQTENKHREQLISKEHSSVNDDEQTSSDKPHILDKHLMCKAISCDFEQGSLCEWEASEDTILPNDRHYRHRNRRSLNVTNIDERQFVQRTWHNWEGRYRNRLTGIARAQVFSSGNRRFAAAYLKPNQRATLTARMLSKQRETLRFRAWEATRDMRLRVCCDSTSKQRQCVFETERGVRRGSRNWKEYTAKCPEDTEKVIFECVNDGLFQGACGVDNVHLLSDNCPNIIPIARLHENRRMA